MFSTKSDRYLMERKIPEKNQDQYMMLFSRIVINQFPALDKIIRRAGKLIVLNLQVIIYHEEASFPINPFRISS